MTKELVDKITILELKQELKEHLNNVTEVLNEAKEEIIRLVKENKELKAQIEKMKCCENCKHHCFWGDELKCMVLSYEEELKCMKTKEHWEIKEND